MRPARPDRRLCPLSRPRHPRWWSSPTTTPAPRSARRRPRHTGESMGTEGTERRGHRDPLPREDEPARTGSTANVRGEVVIHPPPLRGTRIWGPGPQHACTTPAERVLCHGVPVPTYRRLVRPKDAQPAAPLDANLAGTLVELRVHEVVQVADAIAIVLHHQDTCLSGRDGDAVLAHSLAQTGEKPTCVVAGVQNLNAHDACHDDAVTPARGAEPDGLPCAAGNGQTLEPLPKSPLELH